MVLGGPQWQREGCLRAHVFDPTTTLLQHRGRELCATTQLLALFRPIRNGLRFSKPVRHFMRIKADCPSQSKGWESPDAARDRENAEQK